MPKASRPDLLGDRMKRYEATTRFLLPRRTYTIMRVDGRAFHTWTKGLERPYDIQLMDLMDATAVAICEQVAGSQFAYVQSDEISVLCVDFLDKNTEPWFDGGVQKWASVGASIATAAFNYNLMLMKGDSKDEVERKITKKLPNATFDARVFTVPDLIEVENYFVWRQKDAERNSVTMLAQHFASHKELMGKNRAAQHDIIHKAGDNWAKHPARFKHGAVIRKQAVDYFAQNRGEITAAEMVREGRQIEKLKKSNWFVDGDTPEFTKTRHYIRTLVPVIWDNDLLIRKASANG